MTEKCNACATSWCVATTPHRPSAATSRSLTHSASTRAPASIDSRPAQLRRYHLYLLEERRLAVGTVVTQICALRFFCRYVLKQRDVREDIRPIRSSDFRLPVVLSPDEVQRLIGSAKNLYHRTLLMTLYGAGLRRSEACRLKVRDIDSQRMVLRVEQGKGGRNREIPLSPTLLAALHQYYRWMRPKTYLFPGTHRGWRADAPITTKVIWEAVRLAARRRASTNA